MNKNIAALLLMGVPLISSAYQLTIYNNSSLTIKVKESTLMRCIKISPRKEVIAPGESKIFNYLLPNNEKNCAKNSGYMNLNLVGHPVNIEDPELESFSYSLSFITEAMHSANPNSCEKWNSSVFPYRCYKESLGNNEEAVDYKLTADFENIYVSDK